MPFKSYRAESKLGWGRETNSELSSEDIQLGALLRIADASELMAQNHQKLVNERDMYKRMYEERRDRIEQLKKRISALQGVITKLKRKAESTASRTSDSAGAAE